jgi:nucleoside-diphosphate-sugar epimerase
MRAFVTGASGFIGSHLVSELLRRKWEVTVLLHNRFLSEQEKVRVIRGDIRDRSILKEALQGTDVLFHLAAALAASIIKKREFFRINVEGTENVMRAAQETGVERIIHFGSAGVLGSVKKNQPVGEDHPPHPLDIYDRTKLDGERSALRLAREGMDIVVVRPGWAYGPGDRRTFKLIKAVAKKRFLLVTKGKARHTPVYIQDLIEGVLLCVEKARGGEIYHLAGDEVLSVRDMVSTIAESAHSRIPSLTLPLLPVRIAAWLMEKSFSFIKREPPLSRGKLGFFIHPKPLSIKKAKNELGYNPQTDFQTGMHTTVAWYRDHDWLH